MQSLDALVLVSTAWLCAAAPGPAQGEAAEHARPPSVVLVVVDDLGWSDLGCCGSGYYETPHVDALAAQGMRFTRSYAACAVCSPSRAALLTGRYPARIGVTDWIHHASAEAQRALAEGRHLDGFDPPQDRPLLTPINHAWLDLDEVTIAELLKPRGYATCHVGKWHLGPEGYLPTDQGFDVNLGGFQVGQPPSYFDPYADASFTGILGLEPRREGEYLTDREADEAVSFIERQKDRPFFLYLAHYAVHAPLQARPELIARYREKPKTDHKVPVYAAMVESVDDAVGRVLECLDRNGLSENTLFVFTSDNGGASHFAATDNAPLRKGKGFPYEGGLRVPLIVRWPGVVEPGTICDVPVSGIDLCPTIAAAVGAPMPDGRAIDGRDLGPLLRQDGELARDTLVWHFPHYWWGTRIAPYSVIRQGDWKLIRSYQDGRLELYDLAADPGETRDRAGERPGIVRRLDRALGDALAAQGARLPLPNSDWRPKDGEAAPRPYEPGALDPGGRRRRRGRAAPAPRARRRRREGCAAPLPIHPG